MSRKRIIIFWTIVSVALLLSAAGAAYAWFLSFDDTVKDMQMGVVDISLAQTQYDITSANPIVNFEITNQSNIDYFLRMGYTLVYKDSNGDDLPQNTPDDLLTVRITHLNLDGTNLNLGSNSSTRYTSYGYSKSAVEMLDNGNKYVVFPNDIASITGKLQITFNTSKYPQYFSGGSPKEKLYITIIPESVQATKKAVGSNLMKEVGWDPNKVQSEASTTVDGGVIKN